MYIKQLSVYLENTKGQLAEIMKIIADQAIDIRALSLADTTSFGILRLILDKPNEAKTALAAAGYPVAVTPVIAIGVADTPGSLSKAIEILSNNDISIEYMYAFVAKQTNQAVSILRVDDGDKAVDVLQNACISFFGEVDMDNI
ncbi:MAG: acetolactate synthase [Oscillospiraceae bacterium]|nr:acetolactate synthase [Oscillospiraceae bacterium]